MTTGSAVQDNDRRAEARLVGSFHRFGETGPVYQVVGLADEGFVTICLVESGPDGNVSGRRGQEDPLA